MGSEGSSSELKALAAALNGVDPHLSQWNSVVEEANRHLVAPALYVYLRDRHLLGRIPKEIRDYLRFLLNANEQRNRRLRRQAVEAIGALNEAGIEPLLIKGSALLMILPERRLGIRMISDLDVVVTKSEAERAVERLAAIGYEPLPDNAGLHAYGKFYRPSDAGSLDLHLRPPGPPSLFAESDPRRSVSLRVRGVRMKIPTPPEWVTHLIVHDMIQDRRLRRGEVDLRRLLDCREIMSIGYEIDWDGVRNRLSSFRLALARDLFFLNLERFAGVKGDGGTAGLLARLLFNRQIALRESSAYKRLDSLALDVLRGIWRFLNPAPARE